MLNSGYKDYRCRCGKLFFRGFLTAGAIEIKCKACKNTATISGADHLHSGYYIVGAGSGIRTLNDAPPAEAALAPDRQKIKQK